MHDKKAIIYLSPGDICILEFSWLVRQETQEIACKQNKDKTYWGEAAAITSRFPPPGSSSHGITRESCCSRRDLLLEKNLHEDSDIVLLLVFMLPDRSLTVAASSAGVQVRYHIGRTLFKSSADLPLLRTPRRVHRLEILFNLSWPGERTSINYMTVATNRCDQ